MGRKRQNAVREPSGKKSRRREDVAAEIGTPPAILKRLQVAIMKGMADPKMGTPIGMMYHAGHLDLMSWEAGNRWDELSAKYRSAIGVKQLRSPSAEAGASTGSAPIDPDSEEGQMVAKRETATIDRYNKIHTALREYGLDVLNVVEDVVIARRQCPAWQHVRLKIGLRLLALHFGLIKGLGGDVPSRISVTK